MRVLPSQPVEMVKEARRGLNTAEDELKYTVIHAPSQGVGVIVKRYRLLGDFASGGSLLFRMYNPHLDHYLIVPELAIAVEVDGRVVGATFGLPDFNPRIRDINGRLYPFGFIHLLRKKRDIKRIRLISTNVLPEFQLHGLGLLLMNGLVPKALEWGIEEAEFSWVLESNSFSRGALAKGGAKITRTYRLYDWALQPQRLLPVDNFPEGEADESYTCMVEFGARRR